MKRRAIPMLMILTSVWSSVLYGQVNCTVPLPPVLTTVSVQPETSKTEFTWLPSESTDIAAYIVYTFRDGDGSAIDTVWDPAATYHAITNTAPKYSSVSYVVAAHRLSEVPGLPGCTSPLSNALATIFCDADIDSCNKKLTVKWNRYSSEPKQVTGYSVFMSVDGSEFLEESVTGPGDTIFSLNDFTTGSEYCFYIRAALEGGVFSSSNKSCVTTGLQRAPGWINADFASVTGDGEIALSFTADPASDIDEFVLERKTGSSATFQPIATLESVGDNISYTDRDADISIINYYRLSAINNCDIPVTTSNIASNMVLSLNRSGDEINLVWNAYRSWLGSISQYLLLVDAGNGFTEKAIIGAEDTLLILKYQEIMYDVRTDKICFHIRASESSNPYGILGESNSNARCMEPIEKITVPNIFTPNNDLKNDEFSPVLSFTPVSYHLVVTKQQGAVIFESRDFHESWDGTERGRPADDGVYLWFLKVTTPSGEKISRSGTITVLKDP